MINNIWDLVEAAKKAGVKVVITVDVDHPNVMGHPIAISHFIDQLRMPQPPSEDSAFYKMMRDKDK